MKGGRSLMTSSGRKWGAATTGSFTCLAKTFRLYLKYILRLASLTQATIAFGVEPAPRRRKKTEI